MNRKPFIHKLMKNPLSGPEIEQRSFEAIDRSGHHGFSEDQWEIARRMVHTAGDIGLPDFVKFSPDAIEAGIEALGNGAPLYVDSRMIRAGLSMARLKKAHAGYSGEKIFCHIADEDVAREAERTHLPRSLFALRKAKKILDGGIAIFGNAPVALLELNRMIIEKELRPAFVLAMPVGFVHVLESKEEFASLGVPHAMLTGHRGGSALAVAAIHAFCTLVCRGRTGEANHPPKKKETVQ